MSNLKLEDTYGTYDLYNLEGKYYAIDKSYKLDEIEQLIKERKTIHGNNKKDLISKISDAEKWADSRGMYGPDTADEIESKALRANSFSVYDNKIAKNYTNPVRVKTDEGIFVLDGSELNWWDKKLGKNIRLKDINNVSLINAISSGAIPELIFPYENYNIVEYDNIYYGLPHSAGSLDLQKTDLSKIKGILKGSLVKEVMIQIDTLSNSNIKKNNESLKAPPILIETIDNYNIVEYDNIYYGLPHSAGSLDLQKTDLSKIKGILKGSLVKEVMIQIDTLSNSNIKKNNESLKAPPILIETLDNDNITNSKIKKNIISDNGMYGKPIKSYQNYSIVLFEETYYAVPMDSHQINFETDDPFSRLDVISDVSIYAVEELINDELNK